MKTQVNSNIVNASNFVEIRLYTKRWFVLAALVTLIFFAVLNHSTFGVINNMMTDYFHTTYKVTDLLFYGPSCGSLIISPFLAWLSLKELITCRKLMIAASLILAVNSAGAILAFIKPSLFGLLIFGQIFGGIGFAIALTLPTVLAQLWFPENQIGFAVGSTMIGSSGMGLVVYQILPLSLQIPSPLNITTNTTRENVNNAWQSHDKFIFELLYTIQLLLMVFIAVFLLFFVPEKPEKPPSYVQYLKRSEVASDVVNNISFSVFLRETKSLCSDYVFVSYAVVTGVMYNLVGSDIVVLEQLVRYNSIMPLLPLSSSAKAGLVMTFYSIGSAVGNVTSGKLLDKFKKYYFQSIAGSACLTIVIIVASLSIIYKVTSVCLISYFLNGLTSRVCLIAVMDAIMQHTYPKNELFVTSWVVFYQNITTVVVVEVGRAIFERFYTIGFLSYLCVLSFLTTIATVLCKGTTKRLIVEQSENQNTNEATPLNP